MEDEGVMPVGVDQSVFRSTAESGDLCPYETLTKILRKSATQVSPPRLNPCDLSTLEDSLQAADGPFDFGKLRHCGDMAERLQAR